MKFAEPSFNRKNISYDPKVSPFNHSKRQSEEPRRLISLSPGRKFPNLNVKTSLTAQPIPQQITTSRFYDQSCDPELPPSSFSPSHPTLLINAHQQKKFSKTKTIQQFRQSLNSLRNKIFSNQYQIDADLQNLQKQYLTQIHEIDSTFQELFELLNIRFGKCLQRVKYKYESAKRMAEETLQSFDKFEVDIDKNYNSIINELNLERFNDIMYEYNGKLVEAERKIGNTPDLRLSVEEQKRVMGEMVGMLMGGERRGVGVRGRSRSSIEGDGDRENDMNFENVCIQLTSSKTMKNSKR